MHTEDKLPFCSYHPARQPLAGNHVWMSFSISNRISMASNRISKRTSYWISSLNHWRTNQISDLISGLICSPGILVGSCFAILICILAAGPASSADSAGIPPCSEGRKGACNVCLHPSRQRRAGCDLLISVATEQVSGAGSCGTIYALAGADGACHTGACSSRACPAAATAAPALLRPLQTPPKGVFADLVLPD